MRLRTVEIPHDAVGRDPMGLVEYARARNRGVGYDHIICAFDRDTHHRFGAARDRIKKLAAGNKIPIVEAVSIPAFEFWILLHYERTAAPFAHADAVIDRLKGAGYIPNYVKADAAVCRDLARRLNAAVDNALWLVEEERRVGFSNPFTNMHLTLQLLKKLVELQTEG